MKNTARPHHRKRKSVTRNKFSTNSGLINYLCSMFAYRSSVQKSTTFTPHQFMFERKVRLPIDIIFGGGSCTTCRDYVSHLWAGLEDLYLTAISEHTQQAQKYKKQYYDERVTDEHFSVGDKVWLYSSAVPRGHSPKFYQLWNGPY